MAEGRRDRAASVPLRLSFGARPGRRAFLAGCLFVPALPGATEGKRGVPPIAVLVRHAEKAADDPKDPSLSGEGRARAEALSLMLGRAGVTHLFCSEFRRTRETLAPLASKTGLEPLVREASDGRGLASALRALPAAAIAVVAGHSNTVPALARELGAAPGGLSAEGHLDDGEYDRLLVVAVGREEGESSAFLDLRYGS